MRRLAGPFFEIGPKNLLRRDALEALTLAAADAGARHDVRVVLTVPTAMVAPVAGLASGVLVFGQSLDPDPMGPSLGRVTAESLADAGASGVMLNHASNPMVDDALAAAVGRAHAVGLQTIVCAPTPQEAARLATLGPTVLLVEPPALIGSYGVGVRPWIVPTNDELRRRFPAVLLMHAGGVGTSSTAEMIMALGADGTGSTSGVLEARDPAAAACDLIAATRAGWDLAHPTSPRHDSSPLRTTPTTGEAP